MNTNEYEQLAQQLDDAEYAQYLAKRTETLAEKQKAEEELMDS